jgi:hypothetical protein
MMTPVSQKLNAAKQKHFTKSVPARSPSTVRYADDVMCRGVAKPMPQLFATQADGGAPAAPKPATPAAAMDDAENPF